MRSRMLLVMALGGLAGSIGCATPAAKATCYPLAGWSTPVFRCAGAAEPVAVTPPPEPEPPPAAAAEPEPEPEAPPKAAMANEAIELSETVQFETESAVLLERSKTLLDDVVRELNDHPEVTRVQIEGHTDSVASPRFNRKLSQERVDSVRSYLVSKGIDPKRLTTKAFGERKPTASNKTEEGRAQNRRVEFRILKRR